MYTLKYLLNVSKVASFGTKLNRLTANTQRSTIKNYAQSCLVRKYIKNSKQQFFSDDKLKYYFGAAFLFKLFGFGDNDEEEVPEIVMMIKRSILLIQKGEYNKAEQMLHVALNQAQSLQNYDAVTYIFDVMANLAFDLEQYDKAEKLFVTVMQRIMVQGAQQNDMRIIHMSLKMAKLFEKQNQMEKAESGYQFCLNHLQEHLTKDANNEDVIFLMGMTLDWYAQMLIIQLRLTEAQKYLQEAYKISVRVNGEEHEQTVVLLNDLGTVSCMKGEHEKAIEYLSTAVEIGKKLPNMEDLGSIHVNLGNIFIKKGLYNEARKFCEEGQKISRQRKNKESLEEADECLKEIKILTS